MEDSRSRRRELVGVHLNCHQAVHCVRVEVGLEGLEGLGGAHDASGETGNVRGVGDEAEDSDVLRGVELGVAAEGLPYCCGIK